MTSTRWCSTCSSSVRCRGRRGGRRGRRLTVLGRRRRRRRRAAGAATASGEGRWPRAADRRPALPSRARRWSLPGAGRSAGSRSGRGRSAAGSGGTREVLGAAQQARGRRGERQGPGHGLELLAGLAIDVDAVGLGLDERLAAGGRGAEAVGLALLTAGTLTCIGSDGTTLIRCGGEDAAMRVLIFHGYLLRGTGSNVYNANLAQALAAARPRRPPALPGPRGRDARLDRRGRQLGAAAGFSVADDRRRQPGRGLDHRLPARDRRPAARLRRRPLRGLRGQDLPRAQRRRARRLHRGQRRRRPRRRAAPPAASTPRSPTTW